MEQEDDRETKNMKKRLGDLMIGTETVLIAVQQKSSRILRKVLEAKGNLLSLRLHKINK